MIEIKEIERANNVTFVIYEVNKQIFTKAFAINEDVSNILKTLKEEHYVD